MVTITYAYAVDSTVFHVDEFKGVRKAIVRKVTIEQLPGGGSPLIDYDVAFVDARDGVITTAEATLYDNVDTALAFYKTTYVI